MAMRVIHINFDKVIPARLASLLRMNIDWQSVENSLKSYCEDSQAFLRTVLGEMMFLSIFAIYEFSLYAK